MQTFAAHLSQKQVLDLAEQVFGEMTIRNVDPNRFVEWYVNNGDKHNDLPVAMEQWLNKELILAENAFGRGIGDTLGNAWKLGSQALRTGAGLAKKVPGLVKDTAQSAANSLGQHLDQNAGRKGVQRNFTSPSGYYNADTGHYVKSQFDPKPIDRMGRILPPELANGKGPIEDLTTAQTPRKPQQNQQVDDDDDDFDDDWNDVKPPRSQANNQQTNNNQQANNQTAPNAPEPVQNAMTALSNLSKVLINSKVKQNPLTQNQKLIQGLHYLLGTLRGIQPAQPQQQQVQPPPIPARQSTHASGNWQGDDRVFDHVNNIENQFLEMKVRQICKEMLKHNVDPQLFADWYTSEGYLLTEFNQDIRDWWGRTKQRFSNAWGAFKDGGNQSMSDQENKKITQATQQVMQALQLLQSDPNFANNPDLKAQLDTVLKELQGNNKQPQQDQLPENPPDDQPPQQQNQSKGLNPYGWSNMEQQEYEDKAFFESIYGNNKSRWFI